MRGATVEVTCECGTVFAARVADRKRGWAKSCSKSCAAIKSNRETGKYEKFKAAQSQCDVYDSRPFDTYDDPSWDAHKNEF